MRTLLTRLAAWLTLATPSLALAQATAFDTSLLVVPTARQQGLFTKEDVLQKALLLKSSVAQETALLVFRGWPGIARLQSANDWRRNLNFMQDRVSLFLEAGISLVIVDCPTDHNALLGAYDPASCDDAYRSSRQHVDDVTRVIDKLKTDHGLSRFYVFGHSYGTISSKWLAHHLGDRLAGSIHSAAQTRAGGMRFAGYASTAMSVDLSKLQAPSLHIHHGNDACPYTPYETVQRYAGANLVTVRGGRTSGDPCGARHYHSYEGRESEASQAVIAWITRREVQAMVGAPD